MYRAHPIGHRIDQIEHTLIETPFILLVSCPSSKWDTRVVERPVYREQGVDYRKIGDIINDSPLTIGSRRLLPPQRFIGADSSRRFHSPVTPFPVETYHLGGLLLLPFLGRTLASNFCFAMNSLEV